MKIILVDNHTSHLDSWRELCDRKYLELEIVSFTDAVSIDSKSCDLVILSGGTGLAIPKSREQLQPEIQLIKNIKTPLLGVCLGFELIADAFGAKLLYRQERVTGKQMVTVIKDDPIFGGVKEFTAKLAHKYYIEELPEEFVVLAKHGSDIQAYKHREKMIYGFQFHPEVVDPKNQGTQIFLNLLNLINKTN